MKKLVVFALAFVMTVSAAAITSDRNDDGLTAENYFDKSVKYYLDGDLDNAITVLTRALQKDPDNTKYGTLYDMMLEERDKLKVIRLTRPKSPEITGEEAEKLRKYIDGMKKQHSWEMEVMGVRMRKVVKALANESTQIKAEQQKIVTETLPQHEKEINSIKGRDERELFWAAIILGFMLVALMLITTFTALNARSSDRAKESIKYLKVRMEEQIKRLEKVEEEQKRLSAGK